jgi:hypothetical protein
MNNGDLLVRQSYARILLGYGGVPPLGDFAEVNSRQGRTIQLKFLNVVQVEDNHNSPADRRYMQNFARRIGQCFAAHRCVAGAEIDKLVGYQSLALTRSNPLVVKVYAFINFAKGGEPFGIERIRKGGAATL